MGRPVNRTFPSLLPGDGQVYYHGPVMDDESARSSLRELEGFDFWQNDEVVMFGKRLVLSRKMAWFGDMPYAYAGAQKMPLRWNSSVLLLKKIVEDASGVSFNSCLLNYYADGSEGMGWHSDDERSLVPNAAIASLSLGAERNFRFKHRRTGETTSVWLENGSLLVMAGETQTHWVHCLPKSKRVFGPRINLTFRVMKSTSEF